MIGLDTSILVRYLLEDDPSQTPRAIDLSEEECTELQPGFINHVVLCELVWVLESSFRYPRSVIGDSVGRLLRVPELRIENVDAASAALDAYLTTRADFADASIGWINREHGCGRTATFDRAAAGLDDSYAP